MFMLKIYLNQFLGFNFDQKLDFGRICAIGAAFFFPLNKQHIVNKNKPAPNTPFNLFLGARKTSSGLDVLSFILSLGTNASGCVEF